MLSCMSASQRRCCTYVVAVSLFFFFFNDTATTEIYTLSLHDALPIYRPGAQLDRPQDLLVHEVDDDHAAAEFARHERLAAVGGVVHVVAARAPRHRKPVAQPHRVRRAEVEHAMGLGDDDRAPTVGGEVEVVGIEDPLPI